MKQLVNSLKSFAELNSSIRSKVKKTKETKIKNSPDPTSRISKTRVTH